MWCVNVWDLNYRTACHAHAKRIHTIFRRLTGNDKTLSLQKKEPFFLIAFLYVFGEFTPTHKHTQLQDLARAAAVCIFYRLWPYLACVWRGQQCQPEVATLLIQANVLLTTAQLHRTPAERGERSRRRGWGQRVAVLGSKENKIEGSCQKNIWDKVRGGNTINILKTSTGLLYMCVCMFAYIWFSGVALCKHKPAGQRDMGRHGEAV